jgi:hypothetical protein
MKHIKKYKIEDFVKGWEPYEKPKGKKWKIPIKLPDFYICLKKAGMPDEQFKQWKNLHRSGLFSRNEKSRMPDPSIEYIILETSVPRENYPNGYFTWSVLDKWYNQEEDNASFKYMGELKASDEEIKDWIDMEEAEKAAIKYNL